VSHSRDSYWDARVAVASACRVLANEGLVSDILGHVSLRVEGDRALVRARRPSDQGLLLSEPTDIVLVDLDGEPAEDLGDHSLPQELPIHTEVLRRRADVGAVVHAHPPEVVAVSIASLPLEPVFGAYNIPAMRMAERGVPTYHYYGLIRSARRATEMVDCLGDGRVVVLQGHGLTAVGPTLAGAVMSALNLNRLAAMTRMVAGMGAAAPPVPVEDREELPDLGSAFHDEASWRAYVARLVPAGLAVGDGDGRALLREA
jgi:ribulose-5-phosphate 4-epimerase/fuculose-1-phosphate aldolase